MKLKNVIYSHHSRIKRTVFEKIIRRKERVRSENNTKVLNDELKRESKNEKFEDYKTLDLRERKVVVNQVPFNKEGTN